MKEEYKELYDACSSSQYSRKKRKYDFSELSHFVGLHGAKYSEAKQRLLVVGRYPQAWESIAYSDGDDFAEKADRIFRSRHLEKPDIYQNSSSDISPFWIAAENVWRGLNESDEEKWYEYIAWTDLYKLSFPDSDPSSLLYKRQAEACKKILDREIRILKPHHILFLTGWQDWIHSDQEIYDFKQLFAYWRHFVTEDDSPFRDPEAFQGSAYFHYGGSAFNSAECVIMAYPEEENVYRIVEQATRWMAHGDVEPKVEKALERLQPYLVEEEEEAEEDDAFDGILEETRPQIVEAHNKVIAEQVSEARNDFMNIINYIMTNTSTPDFVSGTSKKTEDYFQALKKSVKKRGVYYNDLLIAVPEMVGSEAFRVWTAMAVPQFSHANGGKPLKRDLERLIDVGSCCYNILSICCNIILDYCEENGLPFPPAYALMFKHMADILSASIKSTAFSEERGLFGKRKLIQNLGVSETVKKDYEKRLSYIRKRLADMNVSYSEEPVQVPAKQPQLETPAQTMTKPQRSRTAETAVAVAAAAAVAGQVATERARNSSLTKNPYAERYAETQRQVDMVTGQRVPVSTHNCATCTYWCGQRQLVNQPGGRIYVQLPRNVQPAKCTKRVRTIYTMPTNCNDWKLM